MGGGRLVETTEAIHFKCTSRAVERSEPSVFLTVVLEGSDGGGCGRERLRMDDGGFGEGVGCKRGLGR